MVANTLPCASTVRPSHEPRPLAVQFAGVEELAAFAERAVFFDRKRHDDRPLAVRIGDVERLLVRRKRDAVRPFQLFGEQRQLAIGRDAIHALERQLLLRVVHSFSNP